MLTMGSGTTEQHVDQVDAQLLEQHKQHHIVLYQIWRNMVTTKANSRELARRRQCTRWSSTQRFDSIQNRQRRIMTRRSRGDRERSSLLPLLLLLLLARGRRAAPASHTHIKI